MLKSKSNRETNSEQTKQQIFNQHAYIDFIGEGKGSLALNEALIEWEQQIDTLETEIDQLRQTRERVFQTPPIKWIEENLSQFKELLGFNINDSALVFRNLLGPKKPEVNYPILESLITSPILQ